MEQKQNQAYNDRVRALAEEMLRSFKGYKKDTPIGRWEWAYYKDEYCEHARIAVGHMAVLAKKWMTAYAWTTEYLRDYLIKESLIPDQEDGPNG